MTQIDRAPLSLSFGFATPKDSLLSCPSIHSGARDVECIC
jgi:hypothetical protein